MVAGDILDMKFLLILLVGTICVIGVNANWDVEEGLLQRPRSSGEQRQFDIFKLSLLWPGTACRSSTQCCSSNACCRSKDSSGHQREFDFFMLSLLWPGTACRSSTKCCPSNACCRSNRPSGFTIHGLWTDYNDGTWPACCPGPKFDKKEISTLLKPMRKYWPSFNCEPVSNCHHGNGSFWAHEWEKHGTCSSPVIHDEYEYFVTTLNLYFKYNVTGVLFEAGYVPSNSEKYPLGGIISAIQNAFHATPELTCSGDEVEELRICFYKDFQPRDCETGSIIKSGRVSSGSCPQYVSLPTYGSWGNKQVAGISLKLWFAIQLLLIFAFV